MIISRANAADAALVGPLRHVLKIRVSYVLMCACDILVYFPAPLKFSRIHVRMALGAAYNDRTIDRALELMETHGVVACTQAPAGQNGAVYVAQAPEVWSDFNPDVAQARVARHSLARFNVNRAVADQHGPTGCAGKVDGNDHEAE